jgi:hypothetical protein
VGTLPAQRFPVSSIAPTEKRQILSRTPLDADNEQTVDLVSAVRGAMAATGQTPRKDFVVGTSPDGYVHMIGVR